MATVIKRRGRPGWYVKFTDATGRRVRKHVPAATKAEARRIAFELERRAERQALGLETLPAQSSMILAELCRWWLDNKCPPASVEIERLRLERHVCTTELGALAVPQVTTDAVEAALSALERPAGGSEALSAATLNKLRSVLSTVFTRARKAKVWTGPNPITDVESRRVVRRAYATLRADEVAVLLPHVAASWRNLFAAALWTGMRKGELCGLKKTDVDLSGRMLTVARSYDGETTKGRRAAVIPIAEPLMPYLKAAIDASPSEWVFPDAGGAMRIDASDPHKVLRTALARASIIDGWEHVCRRCKAADRLEHTKRFGDGELRRCENVTGNGGTVCGMKLWPRALPRPLRFHDLRHTTATLLLRAGVDPYRVQRILRHSKVTVTTETYGHLVAEDLRAAINMLPAGPAVPAIEAKPLRLVSGAGTAESEGEVPSRVPETWHRVDASRAPAETRSAHAHLRRAEKGIRTLDPCLGKACEPMGSESPPLPASPLGSDDRASAPTTPAGGSPLLPPAPVQSGAQPGAQAGRALRLVSGPLLTVRDVAAQLRVSAATVYSLCERGQLEHLRISNAIRVTPEALARFASRGTDA